MSQLPALCDTEGCNKRRKSKGLCSTHYNHTLADNHRKVAVMCAMCDTIIYKEKTNIRYQVCSNECRKRLQFGWSEPLPPDHWALWYGRTCEWAPPKAEPIKPPQARFTNGQCGECGTWFTAQTFGSPIEFCSNTCSRRVKKRIRRAREAGAKGTFRFVELMRIYMLYDGRCAYCDEEIKGLPEPEHVIPISRGGRNDIANLVPSCRRCNCEKQDMTPIEWAQWRERRGSAPYRSVFPFEDARFRHLHLTEPSGRPYATRYATAS